MYVYRFVEKNSVSRSKTKRGTLVFRRERASHNLGEGKRALPPYDHSDSCVDSLAFPDEPLSVACWKPGCAEL